MDTELVEQVRRFNRIVTQRAGALDDHYLARERPLGEARLLWELDRTGADVRALRSRLGLDSGYLSRLLRSLETQGLVTVEPSTQDRRIRRARLTPDGVAERAVLDQRSDERAGSLLSTFDTEQRTRLVAAMTTVTRLLTASAVEFAAVDPRSPDAQYCLERYFAELGHRFDAGFDPALSAAPDPGEFAAPTGTFLVATLWSEPIACGGLLFHEDGAADIKRMWVAGQARGLGIGRRLLEELERRAADTRRYLVRLETNRALTEAIALYRSAGYRPVEAFIDEAYADYWFAKHLTPDER